MWCSVIKAQLYNQQYSLPQNVDEILFLFYILWEGYKYLVNEFQEEKVCYYLWKAYVDIFKFSKLCV
jgi:hypothetical protein